ncbi:uncharacterized protein [Haliotis asinina]|uniref:uncharacterized protein isoform X2 n=1 Tax=Haliotis asinina TaxID=109174 RepID=UPI0035327AE9
MGLQISFVIIMASISSILGCPYQTDVVFLLDGSESVSESAFLQQKAFVVVNTATLQMTAPSFRHLHVGVEVFSSDVSVITELDKPADPDTFSNFVLAATQPRDGTRTNMALKTLRYMFSQQSRRNTLLKAVLITDGYSKNIAKTIEEARMARNIGVDFIFVGIGSSIKFEEVAALVDDKSKVFLLNTFDELASVSDEVRNAICSGTPVSWHTKTENSTMSTLKTSSVFVTNAIASTSFVPTFTRMDSVTASSISSFLQTMVTQPKLTGTSNVISNTMSHSSSDHSTDRSTAASPTTKTSTSHATNTATSSSSRFTTIIPSATRDPAMQTESESTTSTPSISSISSILISSPSTTTLTPSTTTSKPSTASTSLPTTLMTSTTTRQLVQQDHFTLIPLGLLAGLGGSETLLDILRGSNHDIPRDNSFGIKIPLPLFIAKTPSQMSTPLALNGTLSPFYSHSKTTYPVVTTSFISKTPIGKPFMTLKQSHDVTSPATPITSKITTTNLSSTPQITGMNDTSSSIRKVSAKAKFTKFTTGNPASYVTSTAPSKNNSLEPTAEMSSSAHAIAPAPTTSQSFFTTDSSSAVMEKQISNERRSGQISFDTTHIYTHPECLRVSPDPEDPTQYLEKVGTLTHRRRCARGVAFDPVTCTCALKFIVGFTRNIKTSNEPMVIGSCDSTLVASYYGVMDDIYVYMCAVPKPET